MLPDPSLSSQSSAQQCRTCVVLPAYNESRHLLGVVSRIPAWVDGIVIVDDASTDDTLTVAIALADDRVRVLHHEVNRGVGGAMKTGYAAALDSGYDIIAKMDADDQMDVAELSRLVWPIATGMAEYTKGNRFRRSGRPSGMPWLRWFGNVVLSFFTKVATATGTFLTLNVAIRRFMQIPCAGSRWMVLLRTTSSKTICSSG